MEKRDNTNKSENNKIRKNERKTKGVNRRQEGERK